MRLCEGCVLFLTFLDKRIFSSCWKAWVRFCDWGLLLFSFSMLPSEWELCIALLGTNCRVGIWIQNLNLRRGGCLLLRACQHLTGDLILKEEEFYFSFWCDMEMCCWDEFRLQNYWFTMNGWLEFSRNFSFE